MMHHSLKPVAVAKVSGGVKRASGAPKWPSYTGTSQLVGVSPSGRVTVYVDPSLGSPAAQNASDLLNDADRVAEANDAIFGTTGGPVSVIVFALGGATDGTGARRSHGLRLCFGRGDRSLRGVRPIGTRLRPVRSRVQRVLDGRQSLRQEQGRSAVAMVRGGD